MLLGGGRHRPAVVDADVALGGRVPAVAPPPKGRAVKRGRSRRRNGGAGERRQDAVAAAACAAHPSAPEAKFERDTTTSLDPCFTSLGLIPRLQLGDEGKRQ